MNIAIIGAKSFIGGHLINELYDGDHELFLFSRTEGSILGQKIENMDSFHQIAREKKVTFDLVYYLASDTIPSSSWDNPKLEIENNLLPFLFFLEESKFLYVKKIILISSAGTIYGSSNIKLNENSVKNPFSPYGINKLSMEYYLQYWHLKSGVNYDIFRVSNVYGEGQNTSKGLGILNTILENIAHNRTTKIFGDGSNVRNYIYVKDVAKLLSKSTLRLNSSGIYNLSSESNFSLIELINKIEHILSVKCKKEHVPRRGSDNPSVILANNELMKMITNFKFTSIEDGILRTYDFILKS